MYTTTGYKDENIVQLAMKLVGFKKSPEAAPIKAFLNDSNSFIELGSYHDEERIVWYYGLRWGNYSRWQKDLYACPVRAESIDVKVFAQLWANARYNRGPDLYEQFVERINEQVDVLKSRPHETATITHTLEYIILGGALVILIGTVVSRW